MDNSYLFFMILSSFLFFSSLAILLKLYFFDSLISKNLFSYFAKINGFKFINPDSISSDIYPLKLTRVKDTQEKIIQAIYTNEDDRSIHLLLIEKKTFHPKGGYLLDYYFVGIDILKTNIEKEIKIFPKINNFISSRFKENNKEIISLDPDFTFYFDIQSDPGYIIYLPKLLQMDLLFFKNEFPLSHKNKSITPVITLTPSSFFIVSSKPSSLNELTSFLNLLNIVEANVSK